MSARTWTAEQKQAIEARGGAVLVSAAAGSGKTAVLVERVIRMVCDKENPVSLGRLLVVTFTKAAAAEMRERIGAALGNRLAEDPENAYLLRQQMLLPSAQICTMDSFCNTLVKQYFHELDIAPDFRLADDSERRALEEEVLSACVEDLYIQRGEAFSRLSDLFVLGSSDRALKDTILELYGYAQAYPFPERWLSEIAPMYSPTVSVSETVFGKKILETAEVRVQDNLRVLRKALDLLGAEPPLLAAYEPAIASDIACNETLLAAVQAKRWDASIACAESYVPARLKAAPREYSDSDVKANVTAMRNKAKKTLQEISALFPATEAQHRADMEYLQPVIDLLCNTVSEFSARLFAEKKAQNLYDFNDIAHLALRLLVTCDASGAVHRTAVAEELRGRYDEILLDEYQDTNEAQDMLFSAVSDNEANLFTVGDVKQSIYGFRMAMPEIFLRRRAAYFDYDGVHFPARITLDRNFRSRKNVADGINYIFGQLMTPQFGGVDYRATERLNPAAPYNAAEDTAVELHILPSDSAEGSRVFECRHIAEVIRQAVDSKMPITAKNGEKRPVRYGDFCILMRSSTGGEEYRAALEAVGIPAFYQKKGGFFAMREIEVMTSLLEILNNPLLDVPLCACLLSPIWGFTPDELAEIQMGSHEETLFRKLRVHGSEKCRAFLSDYSELRRLSTVQTPAELLRTVYEKTAYPAIAGSMAGGENRKLNLLLLQTFAEEYTETGKNSLSGFLRYLAKLRENASNVEAASGVSEYADVVRIMTVHKSKGLEFPVVILAKCGTPFNRRDQMKKMLIHPEMKLGLRIYDGENRRTFDSVPYVAAKLAIGEAAQAEELRVLYVALTRAREKLILVGGGNAQRKTESIIQTAAQAVLGETNVPPMFTQKAQSCLDWLIAACMHHPQAETLRESAGIGLRQSTVGGFSLKVVFPNTEPVAVSEPAAAVQALPNAQLLSEIESRVQYRYDRLPLSACPSKVSASALNSSGTAFAFFASARPAFLGKGGLTPAMRGTLTHRFAEICDFQFAAENLEAEIERLTAEHQFTAEEAEALDREKLNAFFRSPLFFRMRHADAVYREQKFTVFFPANTVQQGLDAQFADEKVLVQGIIDCAFLENGRLTVVDYKTDRVRTEAELSERYKNQLAVYKHAAEEIFGIPVSETLLYSFCLQKEISVNISAF